MPPRCGRDLAGGRRAGRGVSENCFRSGVAGPRSAESRRVSYVRTADEQLVGVLLTPRTW
jgi:hypothetical protein